MIKLLGWLGLFEKEGTFCLKGKLENYIQKRLVMIELKLNGKIKNKNRKN